MKKIMFLWPLILLPMASQAAKLFFLDQSDSQECVAKFLEIPSKKETIIMKTKECPNNLIWDLKNKILYYTTEGTLFSRPLDRSKMGPQNLAKLPQKDDVSLSLDLAKNKPVISYLVSVPEKDVKITGKGDSRRETYSFEGKTLDASTTPPWGMPYVAVSAILENGKWKRLEAVATKSDAGDTPGLGVLAENPKMGISLTQLSQNTMCFAGKLECNLSDKKIGKIVSSEDGESYGHIELKKSEFVFATLFGDSLHAVPPVYLCKNHCAEKTKLTEVKQTQLGLSVQERYLLVVSEYSGEDPLVFDEDGKLLYENQHAAKTVWFPGD